MACASVEGANHIIRNGLAIEGKRVKARKLEQEPRRCLKCQKYGRGHLAGECKQERDTCTICAKEHKTRDCKETDPTNFSCITCKAKGIRHDHLASARSCPAFMEAKARLDYRTPEAKYRYFPTDQTWTWEQVEEERERRLDHGSGGAMTNPWTAKGVEQGRLALGVHGQGEGERLETTIPAGKGMGKTRDTPKGMQTLWTSTDGRMANQHPPKEGHRGPRRNKVARAHAFGARR